MTRYLVEIHTAAGKKRTYRIEAANEEAALASLPNRMPPAERDGYTVDAVKPDPAFIPTEAHGTFLLDNHD